MHLNETAWQIVNDYGIHGKEILDMLGAGHIVILDTHDIVATTVRPSLVPAIVAGIDGPVIVLCPDSGKAEFY
jgi:hypothetical protein